MQDVDALEEEVRQEYRRRLPTDAPYGQHVQIIGHPSSGKSTTAKKVASARGLQYIYDPALLRLPRFGRYTEQLFVRHRPETYFAYEVEAVVARFLQNLVRSKDALCDQGIHSIWAYARVLAARKKLSCDEYQTFFALFLTLRQFSPWPRLVVRFRCDAHEAWKRVQRRGRGHESSSLNEEFIEALDGQYHSVMQDFPSGISRTVLDTTGLSELQACEKMNAILDANPTSSS